MGVSPLFSDIINEAYEAEQNNLMKICGMGYRKSLEFLIKDFLITKNPEKESEIKKKFLGLCIKDFLKGTNIEKTAKRAAWLGNDETHYLRIWEDKDLNDLKKLIDLTVHWIEADLLTDQLEKSIPE